MKTRNSKTRILQKSRGAITVFQMAPLCLIVLGSLCGAKLGSRFDPVSAGIGAVIGGFFGWLVCWRLPVVWICKWLDRKRNLSGKTVEELRTMLYGPNRRSPRVVLLELGTRGEKMEKHLPLILNMLVSPLMERRLNGWLTLLSVFPKSAKLISDYRVDDSVEKCQEKVQKLLVVSA
jgi:hypothetical protein